MRDGEPITGVREHVVEFIAWALIVPLRIFFDLIGWPDEGRKGDV